MCVSLKPSNSNKIVVKCQILLKYKKDSLEFLKNLKGISLSVKNLPVPDQDLLLYDYKEHRWSCLCISHLHTYQESEIQDGFIN